MSQRVEQIFSERAARWSERAAIKIGERQVSYGKLDGLSSRLARRLIQQGVGHNSVVAVATGDIEYFAVAVLAILKAGAAYLAVDTRYPVERVRDILTDAAPAIFLADTEFPTGLIPAGLPVIHDFTRGSALDVNSPPSIRVAANANDTACIYYTSGSSGRPKGIEVAHRGIPGLVSDACFVPFGPDDRVGQASNVAFDAITFELWGALLNGGCIVDYNCEAESTDAPVRGGLLCSSVEAGVILVERRERVIAIGSGQPATGGARCSMEGGSLRAVARAG